MWLVRSVVTVILGVTHIAGWHTAFVFTLELSWLASPLGASLCVLIIAVRTVFYSITLKGHRDALLVCTLELVFLASVVTYGKKQQFS